MLIITTVIAVAIAVAAVIALFVAFREERRRSHARVVALRERAEPVNPADEIADGPIAWRESPPSRVDIDDLAYVWDDHVTPRLMFGDAGASPLWGRRIAAAAVTAVIVTTAGYVLLPRSHSTTSQSATGAVVKQAPPLELLSLRHSQEDGRLVITGLVQNPRAGVPLTRVVATAFLFGADGTFLASGRAPLDFSTLAVGDESPFVLSVPVTSMVARYRVGFRGEDGRVIAHVDRRATGTLARTGE